MAEDAKAVAARNRFLDLADALTEVERIAMTRGAYGLAARAQSLSDAIRIFKDPDGNAVDGLAERLL